jgi:hypothetical protein
VTIRPAVDPPNSAVDVIKWRVDRTDASVAPAGEGLDRKTAPFSTRLRKITKRRRLRLEYDFGGDQRSMMAHEEAQECIKSPFTPRIGNREEYDAAIKRLEILSKEPLGTSRTQGVQKLIDAILDYEARHGLDKTAPK